MHGKNSGRGEYCAEKTGHDILEPVSHVHRSEETQRPSLKGKARLL
jgi:hypothetical protein